MRQRLGMAEWEIGWDLSATETCRVCVCRAGSFGALCRTREVCQQKKGIRISAVDLLAIGLVFAVACSAPRVYILFFRALLPF